MKLRDILDEGKQTLKKNKIDDPDLDATEIMLNLLDMDMSRYLFECEDELEDKYDKRTISSIISNFDELISARASHFPLQYILGETYFCGLRFNIDRNVLIPRQDTEILVEKVMADNQDKNKFILDMCTGSGCIAVSLAALGNYKVVVGTDISDDALEIAAKNADELVADKSLDDEMSQHIYFLQSDMFDSLDKIKEKLGIEAFDIITANPPYIRSDEIKKLQKEIKDFEPMLALDGDKDGLKYYKTIAKDAKNYLNDNGKLYLEIGYDQAKDVQKIFEKAGYTHIETVKDLGGNDRVIIFTI
jgi:release factor glutamine methyltransferase